MSIISLADETEKMSRIHKSAVFVCPAPGQPPLLRFTRFENSRVLVDFQSLLSRLKPNVTILIHIPEIYVESYVRYAGGLLHLSEHTVQYNILLQNIDFIPTIEDVNRLKLFGNVSITTAHKAYANDHTEGALDCPLWHFSVWVSPEQYERRSLHHKKNIIIVSPDSHPERKRILALLCQALPEFEFIVIKRMSYQKYKSLIASAKFALTFGEGLDGYFAETVFSGGVGCAVYNDRFFTDSYRTLPCIYATWDQLSTRLPEDIKKLGNEADYNDSQERQFNQLASDYSHAQYKKNLEKFYMERFASS
jgi:hypothetical protein